MNAIKTVCIIFLCIFLQACATAHVSRELQEGKDTFYSGNFKRAFRQLLPPAADGCSEAQYAIGYMYYYGYGVSEDPDTGIFWMERAAAKCNKHAISALVTITGEPRKSCGFFS